MKKFVKLSACMLLGSILTACGGGSSASPPVAIDTPPPPAASTAATVGIILTDASVEDYDHAWVTIRSIELLGAGGNELIFSGEERVDLLALRDTLELFAVNENVTPGDYEKIRMIASDMTLSIDNEDGSTTETEISLVANGKIDLNPRGTFLIAAGEVVLVSLDWDMQASLKLTETGNGNGKIIMRPVIFINIGTTAAFKEGLTRIHGAIELIAADFSVFRICSPKFSTQVPASPVLVPLCLDVLITDMTGLFGPDGMPISASDLKVTNPVTVLGLLRRSMDGPVTTPLEDATGTVAPTVFQVQSIVVEGGEAGKWKQLRGTLRSVVTDNTFDFLPHNGQSAANDTIFSGKLFDSTRLFRISPTDGLVEIVAADLMADDRAVVDSVRVPADIETDPDVLRIAIMLTRAPTSDLAGISGNILGIDVAAGTLEIATISGDRCVTTDDNTKIFEIFVTADSAESIAATLADLTAGNRIGITGEETEDGCFAAHLIIAEG